jgi:hypothetical protein
MQNLCFGFLVLEYCRARSATLDVIPPATLKTEALHVIVTLRFIDALARTPDTQHPLDSTVLSRRNLRLKDGHKSMIGDSHRAPQVKPPKRLARLYEPLYEKGVNKPIHSCYAWNGMVSTETAIVRTCWPSPEITVCVSLARVVVSNRVIGGVLGPSRVQIFRRAGQGEQGRVSRAG